MGNSKTKTTKPVDSNLSAVVKRIHDKCPEVTAGIVSLLRLSHHPIFKVKNGLAFGYNTPAQHVVHMSPDAADWVLAELVGKFHVVDSAKVQAFLRHEWSHFKPKADRQALGQYFTPAHVVDVIKPMVNGLLHGHPDTVVVDPAAGGGALVAHIATHRVVVADRDPMAAALLQELGFAEVVETNSLVGVSRAKFGVADADRLVMVMNPPFKGDNQAQHDCEEAFAATDLSVSFLKMAAALKPAAILCIQPLTTLIKERNFKQLGSFANAYALKSAVVLSSAEFCLGGDEFPLVVACYEPGAMSFANIEQFQFPILRNVGGKLVDQGERLDLSKVQTTKGVIRNMPPNKGGSTVSPLGIYQFNFRHINLVVAKGNLSETPSASMIPVDLANLGQYAYINCLKRHFKKDFVVGNLDPLCKLADLSNPEFLDTCIYDTIMGNSHRMKVFARGSAKSALVTPAFLAGVRSKAGAFVGGGTNPHQAFIDWWDTGMGVDALKPFFVGYFATLKAASLVHVPVAIVQTTAAAVVA